MAETEETENVIQVALATLQARLAALETVGDVGIGDSWVEGIGPDLTEGGGDFPWYQADLGYSISGTVWTARAGKYYPGARGEIAIAARDLDFDGLGLSNGTYYIYLQTNGVVSAEWASPPTLAVPLSDGPSYREWRFKAVWANPVLTRDPTGIGIFNLQLPGTHG